MHSKTLWIWNTRVEQSELTFQGDWWGAGEDTLTETAGESFDKMYWQPVALWNVEIEGW